MHNACPVVPTTPVFPAHAQLTASERELLDRLTPAQRGVLAAVVAREQPFCWQPTSYDVQAELGDYDPNGIPTGVGVVLGRLAQLQLVYSKGVLSFDGAPSWKSTALGRRLGQAISLVEQ